MTPDPWCVCVDMGSFDLIIHESKHYQSVQSYLLNCQHLYREPLTIMLHSAVRELMEDWSKIDFCHGASVQEPETVMEKGRGV